MFLCTRMSLTVLTLTFLKSLNLPASTPGNSLTTHRRQSPLAKKPTISLIASTFGASNHPKYAIRVLNKTNMTTSPGSGPQLQNEMKSGGASTQKFFEPWTWLPGVGMVPPFVNLVHRAVRLEAEHLDEVVRVQGAAAILGVIRKYV